MKFAVPGVCPSKTSNDPHNVCVSSEQFLALSLLFEKSASAANKTF